MREHDGSQNLHPSFSSASLSLSLPLPFLSHSRSQRVSIPTLREKLRLDSSKPPINSANRLDHLLAHGRIRRRARDAHWKRERRDASISRRKISSSPLGRYIGSVFRFFFLFFGQTRIRLSTVSFLFLSCELLAGDARDDIIRIIFVGENFIEADALMGSGIILIDHSWNIIFKFRYNR